MDHEEGRNGVRWEGAVTSTDFSARFLLSHEGGSKQLVTIGSSPLQHFWVRFPIADNTCPLVRRSRRMLLRRREGRVVGKERFAFQICRMSEKIWGQGTRRAVCLTLLFLSRPLPVVSIFVVLHLALLVHHTEEGGRETPTTATTIKADGSRGNRKRRGRTRRGIGD